MKLLVRFAALLPVVGVGLACVSVSAEDKAAEVSASAVVSASVAEVSPAVVAEGEVSGTAPVDVPSDVLPEWPEAGVAQDTPLLQYNGVADATKSLLGDKYATWLGYLGAHPKAEVVVGSGLLQSIGCTEICDMHKALLIVNPSTEKVYVALVDEGHVVMRPSLMSWPDDAITPLKNWLGSSTL